MGGKEYPRVGTSGEGSWGLGAIPERVGDTAILSGEPAQRTLVRVGGMHDLRGNKEGNVPVGLLVQFPPAMSQKCPHPGWRCPDTLSRILWHLAVTGSEQNHLDLLKLQGPSLSWCLLSPQGHTYIFTKFCKSNIIVPIFLEGLSNLFKMCSIANVGLWPCDPEFLLPIAFTAHSSGAGRCSGPPSTTSECGWASALWGPGFEGPCQVNTN